MALPKVCIIGAGCSGFTTAKRMSDFGLPEPEISPFESHGTASGEFLLRAGSGDVAMKGGIERLDGDDVIFTDGSPGTSLYCAVIVKTVDAQTRAKTGINELLRD
jgi:hypothetical protein